MSFHHLFLGKRPSVLLFSSSLACLTHSFDLSQKLLFTTNSSCPHTLQAMMTPPIIWLIGLPSSKKSIVPSSEMSILGIFALNLLSFIDVRAC